MRLKLKVWYTQNHDGTRAQATDLSAHIRPALPLAQQTRHNTAPGASRKGRVPEFR